MELRTVRYFIALAERRHVTRAARAVGTETCGDVQHILMDLDPVWTDAAR
jgi:hypothetical protein